MTKEFIVYMPPKGKDRPRAGRSGMYTSQSTITYENFIKACYLEFCDNYSFKDKSISISFEIHVKPPSKFNKKERELALEGKLKPSSKPDIDNIAKLFLDALNGIAYDDDKSVYKLNVEKMYDTKQFIIVKISDE